MTTRIRVISGENVNRPNRLFRILCTTLI